MNAKPADVLERRVEFTPAYDKRHKDPNKNYGVHGVDLRMLVIGARGAVQFVLYTNWMLPHVEAEQAKRADFPPSLRLPMPADLGYHSPIPLYEDQWGRDDCDLLCGKCFYDGSGLNAERIFDVLLTEGSDGVWRELEAYYDETLPSLDAISGGAA